MGRDFAKQFYASTAWKNCREVYKKKMCYICERCGDVATEVHHIQPLTPDNIHNPEVTLNFNNLMCLCHQCHTDIHKNHLDTYRKKNDDLRYCFGADGHVIMKEKNIF